MIALLNLLMTNIIVLYLSDFDNDKIKIKSIVNV